MTKTLVVADSSSLIIGTKAGVLKPLCAEFDLAIPQKVFEETVVAGKALQKIDALKIEEAIENKKITVKQTKPLKDGKLSRWVNELNLGEGEARAILLCLQSNAGLLLADDRNAIKAAKLLEIKWATIPNIIVAFAENKKISKEVALEALKIAQKEGRYRMDFILQAFNQIEKMGVKK